jgi:mannose-6-phosphate isomerase-like protein (cupin superfamily)
MMCFAPHTSVTPLRPAADSAGGTRLAVLPSLPAIDPSVAMTRTGTIATVPFTLRNLKEDLEDIGSRFDGAPDLEFRLATEALELERSGLGYQRVPPGCRFPYGHTHKRQEEVYVVLRGSGRMKLDDEIVELREWDAVRVPPGTWRGYEAGPEGLEIIVIGAPNLGESPREDVEGRRDWWAG